jgi:acyl-coenzyme A thioesterase PaaI-like protein
MYHLVWLSLMEVSEPAFQDQIPGNHCWGCGPLNDHGLRIKSRWDGEDAICRWTPLPWHAAGPEHILNGGIIATIIDCHCVCTAIANHYREEDRLMTEAPLIWCVTAALDVSYLAPTPIDREVVLRAQVEERKGKKTIVRCSLVSGETECARARLVAIRVPAEWREQGHAHAPAAAT